MGLVQQQHPRLGHQRLRQEHQLALTRALAPKPRLLLLDEPFSNLDVDLRERLAHGVRGILKAASATALFVTHDQLEAFATGETLMTHVPSHHNHALGEWIGIRAEVDHVVTFARGASATSPPAPGVARHSAQAPLA